jgi:hypothetical protein
MLACYDAGVCEVIMTKLDSIAQPSSLALPAASHMDREPGRRLIVLIPDAESDNFNVTQRIWEITSSLGLDVLFLSLCSELEEAQIRRKLVTMAAIIKDGRVPAEIMIRNGNDWVGQVNNIWQEGDVVACYSGQKVGLWRKSLDQILKSSLQAPIYILSDYHPVKNSGSTFLLQAISWGGSLAIIGTFLWAEVKITQLPQDWTHTLLLYVCLFAEIGLIWVWNSIFA